MSAAASQFDAMLSRESGVLVNGFEVSFIQQDGPQAGERWAKLIAFLLEEPAQ